MNFEPREYDCDDMPGTGIDPSNMVWWLVDKPMSQTKRMVLQEVSVIIYHGHLFGSFVPPEISILRLDLAEEKLSFSLPASIVPFAEYVFNDDIRVSGGFKVKAVFKNSTGSRSEEQYIRPQMVVDVLDNSA